MTDYASEQAMEIEALEAILMDDLEKWEGTNPDGWNAVGDTYKVLINPTEEGDEPPADEDEKLAELIFAHSANYPGKFCRIVLLITDITHGAKLHAGKSSQLPCSPAVTMQRI